MPLVSADPSGCLGSAEKKEGRVGGPPAPDAALSPQLIPFSVPRIEYAFIHLFTGGLYADGGATLLEKLCVCWDSEMGHGGKGAEEGAGGSLSARRGTAGLSWRDASG